MTEAMPFLQKAILLSYAPRRFRQSFFFILDRENGLCYNHFKFEQSKIERSEAT